jgi:hypothetical protein
VVKAIRRPFESRPRDHGANRRSADAAGFAKTTGAQPAAPVERSSNLRIKRTFSDQDRDHALTECFKYITRFFANSLEELQQREAAVKDNCAVSM